MKIAIASQNKTTITEHAGHCQKFWIYETKESEIIDKKLLELSREESFHHSSADAPHPLDEVQVLIAGGMGRGLMQRLARKEIEGIITKETDLDKAVSAYLDGSLVRGEPECQEHEHQHRHQHHHEHRHECAAGSAN